MTVERGCTPAEAAVAAAKRRELTVIADDEPIAVIQKNAQHSVVIRLRQYKGYQLLDIRVHYRDERGELGPTKDGICVRVEKLPALVAGLKAALDEAMRRGLLPKRPVR